MNFEAIRRVSVPDDVVPGLPSCFSSRCCSAETFAVDGQHHLASGQVQPVWLRNAVSIISLYLKSNRFSSRKSKWRRQYSIDGLPLLSEIVSAVIYVAVNIIRNSVGLFSGDYSQNISVNSVRNRFKIRESPDSKMYPKSTSDRGSYFFGNGRLHLRENPAPRWEETP